LWSLHSWRSWWSSRKVVKRYHNCWHTLLEAFLNRSLRSAFFTDKAFFPGKKQNFQFWNYSLQVPDCQDFQIIGHSDVGLQDFAI
jgi:hypothetical protein